MRLPLGRVQRRDDVGGNALVVLVGMPKAVAVAVKRAEAAKRCSALRSGLQFAANSREINTGNGHV